MKTGYNYFQNGQEEMSYTVNHRNADGTETLIAVTDTSEKAHFLSIAANAYKHEIKFIRAEGGKDGISKQYTGMVAGPFRQYPVTPEEAHEPKQEAVSYNPRKFVCVRTSDTEDLYTIMEKLDTGESNSVGYWVLAIDCSQKAAELIVKALNKM
ncbi:hypothetical protein GCM10027051_16100 [Niabella terrae]